MVKERGWEGLVARIRRHPTRRAHAPLARGQGAAGGDVHCGRVTRSGSTVTGLLVGVRDGARLLYRGSVEWRLFRKLVAELMAGVEGLVRPSSPFADLTRASSDVVWLEPRLVVEVSYSEMMEDRLVGRRAAVDKVRKIREVDDIAGGT